jgi:hypothetical protein
MPVARVWVLWADCDSPQAVTALEAFRPAPAIVVRSGSAERCHAYWTLTGSLGAEAATGPRASKCADGVA